MITVKVTYKVKPEFAAENKRNIATFLTHFKEMKATNFLYHVYVKEDGVTFVHVGMYQSEEIQKIVLDTPSFVNFQKQRDESGLVTAPLVVSLQHLGSSLGLIK